MVGGHSIDAIRFNNGWIKLYIDILPLMSRLASKICHHTLTPHFNSQIHQTWYWIFEYHNNYFVCVMLLWVFIETPEKYLQILCVYAFISWINMVLTLFERWNHKKSMFKASLLLSSHIRSTFFLFHLGRALAEFHN